MTPETATPADDLKTIARHLLNQDILAAQPVQGGGNNRVYRVTAEGGVYALKFYPPQEEDRRDRLGQEFATLEFMAANGIDCVPIPIAADKDLCCGIYEWMDGETIEEPNIADIDSVLAFIETLKRLGGKPDAAGLPLASEACLSLDELVRQIEKRFQDLKTAAENHDELKPFLNDRFFPNMKNMTDRALQAFAVEGADPSADIEFSLRTLNPSDFGFHNALRRPDGSIVFLDFEYFGWDDPVKLVSDFLLHPGHRLSTRASDHFFQGAHRLFGKNSHLSRRLEALYPLYGLRWCLIILGEYLPHRMARRRLAGHQENDMQVRRKQLEKASVLFDGILSPQGKIPYGG